MVYITSEVLQERLRAGFVEQRQRLVARPRRLQLQLLLPAERGNFSPIALQMPLRGLECFLRFVQILADVLVPRAVLVEMQHPEAPPEVRARASAPPHGLR